jgi:hypothetical protein
VKFIKYLVVVFALSVLCVKSGVSAWTYTVYTQALKSLAGVTEEGQLYKNSLDNQILVISNVYSNRDIKFRISHQLTDSWTDSTWQSVSNSGSYPMVLQINGGMLQELIAVSTGNKKLTMKTSGVHVGVTGINGTWWISENEYNEYKSL